MDVAGVSGVDAEPGGGGDGVLVGSEKEELPAFLTAIQADQIAEVLHGVVRGGVFLAVGKDGEDDFAGLFGIGQAANASIGLLDGAADRIE